MGVRPAGRKSCVDCPSTGKAPRPAPHPGPRCATHHRDVTKARKGTAHERYLERVYKMPPGTYDALLAHQGGFCYICQRAKGISKKLAVDHDHKCCPETPTCGECTRGLLCGPCNKLLGHGRDNPEFFRRAGWYLVDPPFKAMKRGE